MWLQTLPNGTGPHDVMLWFDGLGSSDVKSKTAYTVTGSTATTKKHGGGMQTSDESSFIIDFGSEIIGTGDVTTCMWFNLSGYGAGGHAGNSILLYNSKFAFLINTTAGVDPFLKMSSTWSSPTVTTAANSIVLGTEHFVAITRKSDGKASFYIDGELSGTADRNSGTPIAGTSNLICGQSGFGDYFIQGKVAPIIIFSKILTQDQIRQMYNKHK